MLSGNDLASTEITTTPTYAVTSRPVSDTRYVPSRPCYYVCNSLGVASVANAPLCRSFLHAQPPSPSTYASFPLTLLAGDVTSSVRRCSVGGDENGTTSENATKQIAKPLDGVTPVADNIEIIN